MEISDYYGFFVGPETKFVDNVPGGSKEIAENFWASLNSTCGIFFGWFLICSILGCIIYFTIYNNLPGRHYKITHWFGAYMITCLIAFLGSAVWGYLFTNPSVTGSEWLIWRIAFGNLIYSVFAFLVISFVWWLLFPTNAYRPINRIKF